MCDSMGLTINSTAGDFHIDNVQAYYSADDMPKCGVVIVAFKSTNQHLLKSLLPPLLKEDTWVLLIQNGIGLEEDFVRDFPHTTVLTGFAFIYNTKTKPGVVDHTDLGRLNIGDYNSETSAKPHIDSKIINITHWLSIVAFRCKKTFAEVS